MSADAIVRSVVAHFDSMLGDEAELGLDNVHGATVELTFRADAAACTACVLAPEEIEILVFEALQAQRVAIESVHVRDLSSNPASAGGAACPIPPTT